METLSINKNKIEMTTRLKVGYSGSTFSLKTGGGGGVLKEKAFRKTSLHDVATEIVLGEKGVNTIV